MMGLVMEEPRGYAFVDCGDGRRLESFGGWLVDRPAPTATGRRGAPSRWVGAAVYRGGAGWQGPEQVVLGEAGGSVGIAGATMLVRPAPSGNVGLFPEHAVNAAWLASAVRARGGAEADTGNSPRVLNLFAYTGLATIVATLAGATVTHVDASRPTVAWARANAEQSGLATSPIRWLVDDALALVHREARRERRYSGVVLDPPSYGHGTRGDRGAWRFDDRIDELLEACAGILTPGAFWLLTTHTPGWDPARLARTLADASGCRPVDVDPVELRLRAESGGMLSLGAAARLDPLRGERR